MSGKREKWRAGSSIVTDVLSNWGGFFIFVVSGVVMPRLIDHRLGQELLGIWDFSWSLVAYAGLLGLGLTSTVSRYVARYRELNDTEGLNRVVGACLAVVAVTFGLALVAVGVMVWLTETLVNVQDPGQVRLARWLVLISGINAAVQLPLGLFNGVITGMRRFDLKNGARIVCHLASVAGMVGLILSGFGLISLALVSLAAELANGGLNVWYAKRLLPELRLRLRGFEPRVLLEVCGFGGKTMLQQMSRMTMYQTSSLIVSYFLGPAMLAVYARQRALILYGVRFMSQYGNVFVPAASEAHAKDDLDGLRRLFLKSTRLGYALAMPLVALLAISGGAIVRLWMGSGYEASLALAVLALGHLSVLAHRSAFMLLAGMNLHGRPALADLLAALLSVPLGIWFVGGLGWGLVGAAAAVGLCSWLGGGLVPGLTACRVLKVRSSEYFREAVATPLLASTPFVACLLIAKQLFPDRPLLELAAGGGVGGLLMTPLYWRFLLPDGIKDAVQRLVPGARARARRAAETASGA